MNRIKQIAGEARAARKCKKNWLHVNIGESEAKELRALAKCWGLDLRTFLELGVRSYKRELEKKLNITAEVATKMTRKQRVEFNERHRLFWQAASCRREKLN
jgi:hypothetical protein